MGDLNTSEMINYKKKENVNKISTLLYAAKFENIVLRSYGVITLDGKTLYGVREILFSIYSEEKVQPKFLLCANFAGILPET